MKPGQLLAWALPCTAWLVACRAIIGASPFELAPDGGAAAIDANGSGDERAVFPNPTDAAGDGAGSLAGDATAGDATAGGPDSMTATDANVADAVRGDATGDAPTVEAALGDGPVSPGTIAYVQSTSVLMTQNDVMIAFPAPLRAGSTVVLAFDYTVANPTVQITDSRGSTYHRAIGGIPDGAGSFADIWYALGVPAGADTVHVTFSGVASDVTSELYLHEYAGISALDAVAGASGNAALMESGFATTRAAGELIFGFGVTAGAQQGPGFTLRENLDANVTEDMLAGMAGSYEATAMQTGAPWAMLMATFAP